MSWIITKLWTLHKQNKHSHEVKLQAMFQVLMLKMRWMKKVWKNGPTIRIIHQRRIQRSFSAITAIQLPNIYDRILEYFKGFVLKYIGGQSLILYNRIFYKSVVFTQERIRIKQFTKWSKIDMLIN